MDLFTERSASPMLIAQQMEAFASTEWIYELKMDGFRCLTYMDRDSADFRNKRNMQMLSRFPELRNIYRNTGNRCILDGEIVVLVNGVPDFYRLQKRTLLTDRFKIELESKRFPASFVAFDCIYKDGRELVWEALMERRQILSQLVREDARIAVSRYIETEGTALYRAADEKELEGVVAKRKESIYLMGRRTKPAAEKAPFPMLPAGNEDAVWAKPERVCVVEYMPNTQNALRQPVLKVTGMMSARQMCGLITESRHWQFALRSKCKVLG